MKKISKPNTKYSFRDLDEYLQNYFLSRLLLIVGLYIFGIVLAIKIKDIQLIKAYYIITILYTLYKLYYLIAALNDNIMIYEGPCIKKDLHKYELAAMKKSLFNIWGKCSATFIIPEYNPDVYFKVPIGYNYELNEGNVLRVYAFKNSVIKKNENSFIITNPVMIKIAKD